MTGRIVISYILLIYGQLRNGRSDLNGRHTSAHVEKLADGTTSRERRWEKKNAGVPREILGQAALCNRLLRLWTRKSTEIDFGVDS